MSMGEKIPLRISRMLSPFCLLQAWMERVCQSVQYNVSPDSVRAKGWVRVPSTTASLQGHPLQSHANILRKHIPARVPSKSLLFSERWAKPHTLDQKARGARLPWQQAYASFLITLKRDGTGAAYRAEPSRFALWMKLSLASAQ